ncbi:hypothetical protein D0Z03_001895 [Geotrichum reessii]|nr:hypothetical protein D0Z03_001895 [Galactomyces reessii]
MLRQARGCLIIATVIVLLFLLISASFSGPSASSTAFFKTLMSSRDNINELWDATPFESFLKTPNAGSDHSVGFTDASEDLTSFKGIGEEAYKKQKVSLQQKVGFLYGIQGAEMQKGFLVRPPTHHVVDGVVDPISAADAQRQRKDYQNMIQEERETRKFEADKKAKEEANRKAKENEERRKKEEELRKTEEEKKQKAEKAEKEEARKKAKDEKEKIQNAADEEGLKNDRDFLIADAKAHMNPEGTFPKLNDNTRLVIVTPLYDEIDTKKGDVIKNRVEYCNNNNYACLFPDLNTIIDKKYNRWKAVYLLQKMLKSTDIKEGDWVWYLDPSVVITNMSTPVGDILLQPDSLKARLSNSNNAQASSDETKPTEQNTVDAEKKQEETDAQQIEKVKEQAAQALQENQKEADAQQIEKVKEQAAQALQENQKEADAQQIEKVKQQAAQALQENQKD